MLSAWRGLYRWLGRDGLVPLNPVEGVFLSNRGLKLPALEWEAAHSWAAVAFVAGIVLLGLIGLASNALLALAERQWLKWQRP